MNRGLDFSESRLYVLDGGKVLHAAAKQALDTLHRGTGGFKSECGTEPGGRVGGNADRASAVGPAATAQEIGQHQRHRVGLLNRRTGLRQCETMAWRGSARALGGVRPIGGRETIPPSPGTQTDSRPSQRTGSVSSFQFGGCQTEEGIVEWVTPELLLSTESWAIPGRAPWQMARYPRSRLSACGP